MWESPSLRKRRAGRNAQKVTVEFKSGAMKAILRKLDFSREQFEKNLEEFSEGQKKKVLIAKTFVNKRTCNCLCRRGSRCTCADDCPTYWKSFTHGIWYKADRLGIGRIVLRNGAPVATQIRAMDRFILFHSGFLDKRLPPLFWRLLLVR